MKINAVKHTMLNHQKVTLSIMLDNKEDLLLTYWNQSLQQNTIKTQYLQHCKLNCLGSLLPCYEELVVV